MKEKSQTIKTIYCISIILLYYIAGKNNMFLYTTTLILYSIYMASFSHITLKDSYKKITTNYSKFKILKYISIIILTISLLFLLISILLSDIMNVLLEIDNTFLPYVAMSISIITEPLIKIFLEYLESYNKPKVSSRLLNTYYIFEIVFLLIISIITMRVFPLPTHISISLLYTSKILSFILVASISLIILNKQNINFDKIPEENKINYKKEIAEIITKKSHQSIVKVIKQSYYYISIIILYTVLSTRYSHNLEDTEIILTFIYLYAINIMNCTLDLIKNKIINHEKNIINKILTTFKFMITISIFIGFTSPLICNIIFGEHSNSIYLMMIGYLSIFVALFDITFEHLHNKKIIYISLITGIISKIILIVPLINSFSRMGYNLIYGDIISTMISMFISVIINYIYIRQKNKKDKTLEKIMNTLYDSIMLCIILVILEFIIPTTTNGYFKSIIILGLYAFISITFLNLKKKRG